MSQPFDHIVQQLNNISQQEKYALRELLDDQLAIGIQQHKSRQETYTEVDPLAGLRVSTGISDLASRFTIV